MKCVSVDQVVGEGGWRFRKRGRYGPLSARHLLLIALVLRLRVSPWSLMHAWYNVFTCSSCIMHGQGEGYSVVEDPLPTGPVFSLRVCALVCGWADFHSATLRNPLAARPLCRKNRKEMEHRTTNNFLCPVAQTAAGSDRGRNCHWEAVSKCFMRDPGCKCSKTFIFIILPLSPVMFTPVKMQSN